MLWWVNSFPAVCPGRRRRMSPPALMPKAGILGAREGLLGNTSQRGQDLDTKQQCVLYTGHPLPPVSLLTGKRQHLTWGLAAGPKATICPLHRPPPIPSIPPRLQEAACCIGN
eukprot:1150862-Pelagomonas_calceolata.AAC.10